MRLKVQFKSLSYPFVDLGPGCADESSGSGTAPHLPGRHADEKLIYRFPYEYRITFAAVQYVSLYVDKTRYSTHTVVGDCVMWKGVRELPIWDRDASTLASMWVSGEHCSTHVGTGSRHKRGSYVHLLDRVCIINSSSFLRTRCIQLNQAYIWTKGDLLQRSVS